MFFCNATENIISHQYNFHVNDFMMFRCGIPVVIMGETGCGKTRLIRYMCDLARQRTTNKNMLILKVWKL